MNKNMTLFSSVKTAGSHSPEKTSFSSCRVQAQAQLIKFSGNTPDYF